MLVWLMRIIEVTLVLSLVSCSTMSMPEFNAPQPQPVSEVIRDEITYLNISINQITTIKSGMDLDGTDEFRLFMIITDREGNDSAMFCPYGTPYSIRAGETIEKPCSAGLSMEESTFSGDLAILIMGVDEDETDDLTDITYEAILNVGAIAVGKAVFGTNPVGAGSIVLAQIGLDSLLGYGGGKFKEYLESQDVIGSQSLLLRQEERWGAGKLQTFTTLDGGMEVRLSIEESGNPPQQHAWAKKYNEYNENTTVSPTNTPEPNYDATRRYEATQVVKTVIAELNQPKSQQTPEEFIYSYFDAVNSGRIEEGWNMLSDHYKQKVIPQGYETFYNWYAYSVKESRVISTNLISNNGNRATIDLEMAFENYDGSVDTYDLIEYELVYDTSQNHWLFYNYKLLKGYR